MSEQCEVVGRIFRLYLDIGTCNGVARRLTTEGVPAPRGEKWWGATVKGILTNPVYAACNVYGRHEKGDTRVKPREEWTVVPGMREGVVPKETLRSVQQAMAHRPAQERCVQFSEHRSSLPARAGTWGSISKGQEPGRISRLPCVYPSASLCPSASSSAARRKGFTRNLSSSPSLGAKRVLNSACDPIRVVWPVSKSKSRSMNLPKPIRVGKSKKLCNFTSPGSQVVSERGGPKRANALNGVCPPAWRQAPWHCGAPAPLAAVRG